MLYTVQIEGGNFDGSIWQAVAPSETATGDSAEEVAEWAAANQTVAEDRWRVLVWEGENADTSTEPAAEYYHE